MKRSRGETGRKADLIKRIMITRNINGATCQEAQESVKGYNRKTVADLLAILKEETPKCEKCGVEFSDPTQTHGFCKACYQVELAYHN